MHSISWDWKTSLSEDKINGVNYRDNTRRNSVPVCRKHETGVEVHITTEQQPCQISLEYVFEWPSPKFLRLIENLWPDVHTQPIPQDLFQKGWAKLSESIYAKAYIDISYIDILRHILEALQLYLKPKNYPGVCLCKVQITCSKLPSTRLCLSI